MDAPFSLQHFLPYRLNRIAAVSSQAVYRLYAGEYGLTVPEWRVLATLGEFDGWTAKAIGAHAAMHKTKVSRAVEKLEARRWLVRATSPADRRAEHLSLTGEGRRHYAILSRRLGAAERGWRERLGEDEARTLVALLEALEGILDAKG